MGGTGRGGGGRGEEEGETPPDLQQSQPPIKSVRPSHALKLLIDSLESRVVRTSWPGVRPLLRRATSAGD